MTSNANVDIYLKVDGLEVCFLSIPYDDVQRLSVRPFKWMRFVMFCVCGARGDLSATPDGPPVDYDSTSLADITEVYYKAQEDFIVIDCHPLSDGITSSEKTQRRSSFRKNVMARDGEHCLVTNEYEDVCDAAHLIPRSKGDEYLRKIIGNRSSRYDSTSWSSVSGIDATENGVFLSATLHALLSMGAVAFIKTPNFAMDPADIPRFEPGPMPSTRFTLQCFKMFDGYDLEYARKHTSFTLAHGVAPDLFDRYSLGSVDARFRGSGESLPPAIILDFLYGVAAYHNWKSGNVVHSVMMNYHTERYQPIPLISRSVPSSDKNYFEESGDSRDIGHEPHTQAQKHGMRRADMVMAMDELNTALMYLSGTTPEEVAIKQERRMEEEELMAKEASHRRVTEWMQNTEVAYQ